MAQAYQTRARRSTAEHAASAAGVGNQSPRGAARREAILRAAVAVVGEDGPDALTHRAVAERAGVPLSATTYYFASKEELFQAAVELSASEEVARLERLVLDLAPRDLTPADWAREVAAALSSDLADEPARPVAFYEFMLEAARRPALRGEVARWETAQLRLADVGLRAVGSNDPATDAMLVVATITGLVLAQLGSPHPRFEDEVLRPALERLFVRLV
jgi:DNA-binding transcriptional regulator YbjK